MDFVVQKHITMEEEEIWKDVVGYEGSYQISSIGRLRSLDRTQSVLSRNGNPTLYRRKGLFMSLKIEKNGYVTQTLRKDGCSKTLKIHRLVAIAFIPNPENKPQVNHKNGIKTDNRLENLEWVTTFENRKHAYDIGLQKPTSGIINGMCTHTENEIKFILKQYECGMRQIDIVNRYRFSKELVNTVVNKKAWKHIELTPEDYE